MSELPLPRHLRRLTFGVSLLVGAAAAEAVRGAIIIALAADEFIIAGSGIVVTFAPVNAGDPTPK